MENPPTVISGGLSQTHATGEGVVVSSESVVCTNEQERDSSLLRWLQMNHGTNVGASLNSFADEDGNRLSVELDTGGNKDRDRKFKLKRKSIDPTVPSTFHTDKLPIEDWMISSEDDECSDMISEDYSRRQQREEFLTIQQQQVEEEDVILNMRIVFEQHTDFSVEDDDNEDCSSLSSFDSRMDQDTADVDEILSDSEHMLHYGEMTLLGHSQRTLGSEIDRSFLFSPVPPSPEAQAIATPGEQAQEIGKTPQRVTRLVSVGDVDDDESDNDGDLDDTIRKRVGNRSIMISVGQEKSGRKENCLSDSVTELSPSSTKGRLVPRKAIPHCSPGALPFRNDDAFMEDRKSNKTQTSEILDRKRDQAFVKRPPKPVKAVSREPSHRNGLTLSPASSKQKEIEGTSNMSTQYGLFSPESPGRTFLPNRFRHGMGLKMVPAPLHPSETGYRSVKDRVASADVSVASTDTSSERSDHMDENGNRPPFISDVEYTAPLIDKSELPTVKTKKSLSRKRSFLQPVIGASSASSEKKAHNNQLLASLLNSKPRESGLQVSVDDDASSRQNPVEVKRSTSISCAGEDVSVCRSDENDDYSLVSETSADSIHRNVQVRRTNRRKKNRKGKELDAIGDSTVSSASENNINLNAKKKKIMKKARPKKRGRKAEYQQCPGDSTDELKTCDSYQETNIVLVEERIEAIFNNKNLIFSEIDKKSTRIGSILNPPCEDDSQNMKPKSVRTKSKAHLGTNIPEHAIESTKTIESSRSRTRSPSRRRTRGKSVDSSNFVPQARPRSKSMDSGARKGEGVPSVRLRGKRSKVVGEDATAAKSGPPKLSKVGHDSMALEVRRTKRELERYLQLRDKAREKSGGSKEMEDATRSTASIEGDTISLQSLTSLSKRANQSGSRTHTLVFDNGMAQQTNGGSPSPFSALRSLFGRSSLRVNSIEENRGDLPFQSAGLTESTASKKSDKSKSSDNTSKLVENRVMHSSRADKLSADRPAKCPNDSKQRTLKMHADIKDASATKRARSPIPKEPRGASHVSKKKSPKISGISDSKIDRGIEEALKRHNLGPAVSTLVLGSSFSPSGKSKKESKKKAPSLTNQIDRNEILANTVALTFMESNDDEQDTTPVVSKLERSDAASKEALDVGCEVDVESLRVEVKRKKKQIKQRIQDIKSRTEEDILKMKHDSEQQKVLLGEKLNSIGESDAAEKLMYFCSRKEGHIREEGSLLREGIKEIANNISDQVALTDNLIRESLEIQYITKQVLVEIQHAELEQLNYTTTLDTLRLTHASICELLGQDQGMFQESRQTFLSNFVPNLDDMEFFCLQHNLQN